jgi:hypothetical protein
MINYIIKVWLTRTFCVEACVTDWGGGGSEDRRTQPKVCIIEMAAKPWTTVA